MITDTDGSKTTIEGHGYICSDGGIYQWAMQPNLSQRYRLHATRECEQKYSDEVR